MKDPDFFEIHVIDYIQGSLSTEHTARIEQLIRDNPDLKQEILDLKQTMGILDDYARLTDSPDSPNHPMIQNTGKLTSMQIIARSTWFQAGLAAALVIMALSFAYNLIQPGKTSPPYTASTTYVSSELLEELTENQLQAFTELLALERQRQDELLRAVITEFTIDMEARRQLDLQLIQYELELQTYRNNQQLYQTGLTLNSLIDYISMISE